MERFSPKCAPVLRLQEEASMGVMNLKERVLLVITGLMSAPISNPQPTGLPTQLQHDGTIVRLLTNSAVAKRKTQIEEGDTVLEKYYPVIPLNGALLFCTFGCYWDQPQVHQHQDVPLLSTQMTVNKVSKRAGTRRRRGTSSQQPSWPFPSPTRMSQCTRSGQLRRLRAPVRRIKEATTRVISGQSSQGSLHEVQRLPKIGTGTGMH